VLGASSRGGQLQGRPYGTREGAPAADGNEPKRGGLNVQLAVAAKAQRGAARAVGGHKG
jgi:hypothetical protein